MERHNLFAGKPVEEFTAWVELVIGNINRALTGIDPANVRLHVCWGNYDGPHTHDVPLPEILSRLYEANVGALVISMANARHAHEYQCFAREPLPGNMNLIAGVIESTPFQKRRRSNTIDTADLSDRDAARASDPTP